MSPSRAQKSLCFGYVSETYQNTTNELISLTLFDSQTAATETLEATPGHPFWVSETAASSGEAGNPVRRSLGEGGWTFAGELAEGDELTSATGHALTVTAVKHTQRHTSTFNFAVSHTHTYFVGATSTWAHNASIEENRLKGKMFEMAGRSKAEALLGRGNVAEQVRIRPLTTNGKPANFYIVADQLRNTKHGLKIVEYKSSRTARLTGNQSAGFDLIRKHGAIVEGHTGGSMAPKGTFVRAQRPRVVRPSATKCS